MTNAQSPVTFFPVTMMIASLAKSIDYYIRGDLSFAMN